MRRPGRGGGWNPQLGLLCSLQHTLKSFQGETWSIITSKKRNNCTTNQAEKTEQQKHNTSASKTRSLQDVNSMQQPQSQARKPLTFLRVSPGGCSGVEKLVVGILLAEDTPTFRPAIITLRTTVNNRIHLGHTALYTTQSRSETNASSRDLHMNVSLVHSYHPGHTLLTTSILCYCAQACFWALYLMNKIPLSPPLVL